MKIEIYRYGNYINSVDSKEALRTWLMDNVHYEGGEGVIPPTTTLERCIKIASLKNYSFKNDESNDRIDKILDKVKIEEVAARFVELKRRGNNYVFDCPFCEGHQSGYISPKHQIYKCFVCGKTGNVVNFVMDIKKITFTDAETYLEKLYNIY